MRGDDGGEDVQRLRLSTGQAGTPPRTRGCSARRRDPRRIRRLLPADAGVFRDNRALGLTSRAIVASASWGPRATARPLLTSPAHRAPHSPALRRLQSRVQVEVTRPA